MHILLAITSALNPCMCPPGDEGNITIGNNSNLQDGTVVRSSTSALGTPAVTGTTIGNNVTIGHNATLRACTIGDASLIGMDATILEGAQVKCACCFSHTAGIQS